MGNLKEAAVAGVVGAGFGAALPVVARLVFSENASVQLGEIGVFAGIGFILFAVWALADGKHSEGGSGSAHP